MLLGVGAWLPASKRHKSPTAAKVMSKRPALLRECSSACCNTKNVSGATMMVRPAAALILETSLDVTQGDMSALTRSYSAVTMGRAVSQSSFGRSKEAAVPIDTNSRVQARAGEQTHMEKMKAAHLLVEGGNAWLYLGRKYACPQSMS